MKALSSYHFLCLKVMVCLLTAANGLHAQQRDSILTSPDTLAAIVRAYESNRPVARIPAAISVIDATAFQRFTNASLISAMNMEPGVRMEERSPGSYRLNMRGSSLRAPFGIRNVKVYYNDIPFTDPGGNTYLNQLDFRNLKSVEIIKGPASSLYGAGSGGALLLHTIGDPENDVTAEFTAGSYGLLLAAATVNFSVANTSNKIQYIHQQSDGWRDHTNMRRDIATYENRIAISNKQSLETVMLYGDLYYQTPGGLTFNQYKNNPRSARPASGIFPSAETAKAAVYQQSFLTGITNEYRISNNWKNTTALYGAASWFKNPTFRLYEKRTEPHFGGRTFFINDFNAGKSIIHFVYGIEAQKGIFSSSTYKNREGIPDTILTNDEINNWRYSAFAQAEWLFGNGWNITGGLSYNKSHASIQRLLVYPVETLERTFSSELAPRIAIMKEIGHFNIYASVSQGFSPPTTAELLPGTGVINTSLNAEKGVNYEAGVKTRYSKLALDLSVYHFNVTDAISQRRDASGGDYYINAGKTKQNGIELSSTLNIIRNNNSLVRDFNLYAAYTGNFYTYTDYKVIQEDYSGKELPGTPEYNFAFAADLILKFGLYTNLSFQAVDKIPLNDANSEYADAYNLLSAKLGWQVPLGKQHLLDLFVAADNLLDEVYSLGNDINAAGGRYYNAAARKNYSVGLRLHLNKKSTL